jgi:hypothetical protein
MEYFAPTFDMQPKLGVGREPLLQLTQGDIIVFHTTLVCPDGTPATPENTRLLVALEDRRFSQDKLWQGSWGNGVNPVEGRLGLVEVKVPERISVVLREGAYIYSIQLKSKRDGEWSYTPLIGSLLIMSQPSSPVSDVPYKTRQPSMMLSDPIIVTIDGGHWG